MLTIFINAAHRYLLYCRADMLRMDSNHWVLCWLWMKGSILYNMLIQKGKRLFIKPQAILYMIAPQMTIYELIHYKALMSFVNMWQVLVLEYIRLIQYLCANLNVVKKTPSWSHLGIQHCFPLLPPHNGLHVQLKHVEGPRLQSVVENWESNFHGFISSNHYTNLPLLCNMKHIDSTVDMVKACTAKKGRRPTFSASQCSRYFWALGACLVQWHCFTFNNCMKQLRPNFLPSACISFSLEFVKAGTFTTSFIKLVIWKGMEIDRWFYRLRSTLRTIIILGNLPRCWQCLSINNSFLNLSRGGVLFNL